MAKEKDIYKAAKKMDKQAKLKRKKEIATAKQETVEYLARKRKQAEKAKKEARVEAKASKKRIKKIGKDIKENAEAITTREVKGVKKVLKKNNVSQKTFLGLIFNLIFSIFEFIGGGISGSAAILSDAIHDLGDAISLGFSIYFERRSKHGPDKKYTYGYSRFSVLGVFVTTLILVVGASFMIFAAIMRMIDPSPVNLTWMLILSIIGLIINMLGAFRTKNGRFNVIKAVSEGEVNGIILEDVFGWIVVLVGTIVAMATGWTWIDPLMAILISIYLIGTSFNSFKKVLELFLEKVPSGTSVDVVKYQILAIPHVKDVHDIHLWSMDGKTLCATMHVVVDSKVVDGVLIEGSVDNPINIKQEIRKQLRSTGIKQVTIELESEQESHRNSDPLK